MSLLKQLLLSVSLAVVVILTGTLWFTFDAARSYLSDRLRVDAENSASSLALSLSQPANQDPATQEVLMTALFDSGQYRSIVFTTPQGEVTFRLEREVDLAKRVGPAWFHALLHMAPPTAVRAVSDGWVQKGEVAVTTEDAFARNTLWRMTWQVLSLVIGAGLLWAIFAIWLIRWLKLALEAEISEQVRAIAGGGSTAHSGQGVARPPLVKELAPVRKVIDTVRERVRATAEEQNRQIETLQLELHSDEVTGVANRRYFINELRRSIEGVGLSSGALTEPHGHVLIFRQRDLAAINALHDRERADAWLRNVAESVKSMLQLHAIADRPEPQLARLNGSDFVILLPSYDGPDCTALIQALRQTLDSLRIRTSNDRLCRWCYALTDYQANSEVAEVLARLDHGLMRAESAGHDDVEYISAHEFNEAVMRPGRGETAWKELIQDALRDGRIELTCERAVYKNDDVADRHEAFLMLRDADDATVLISGYLFMPPAVRLGLSGVCDLRAIKLALQWLREHPGHLALRISLPSLLQTDFLEGAEHALLHTGEATDSLQRLTLEIDAHGFVAYPEEVATFCSLAARAGVGVGVRRLAEQPAALLRLHKVTIRYIKLGGDLISGLMDSPGATQLIAAITEAAIGQGVKIYAHDVPNSATAALLREYGVLLPVDEPFPEEDDVPEGGFVDA